MTANVITYRGKSAAREIGKALSFDPETLDTAREPGQRVGIQRFHRHDGKSFSRCGLRPESSEDSQSFLSLCMQVQDLPRHLGQHSGGLGCVPGATGFGCAAGAGDDAGSRRRAMGQRRLRGHGHREESICSGSGMMAVLEESLANHRASTMATKWTSGGCPQNDRQNLQNAVKGRHGGDVSDRKPRADGLFAAAAAQSVSTTSLCRWRSFGQGRSWGRWCIPI